MLGPNFRLQMHRASALIAVAVSAALLIDAILPGSGLCSFASSCDVVQSSWFAKPLGIPLPMLGVLVFGGLFGMSLATNPLVRRWLRPVALVSGLCGAVLIGVQLFILGHVCPSCLLVDSLAIVIAVLAFPCPLLDPLPEMAEGIRIAWIVTAFLLTVTLMAGTVASRSGGQEEVPVPPQIAALWLPDKVTVVEIYDFECPHCRRLEPLLKVFLSEQGDRVRHVRLTVPMPAHSQARNASRAFLCAQGQGKGDEMAGRLIVAPRLDSQACENVAAEIGLSLPAYRSCVIDPATDRRLDGDLAWVKEAHPTGLPVIWIQDQPLTGLRPPTALGELRAALQRAEQRWGILP